MKVCSQTSWACPEEGQKMFKEIQRLIFKMAEAEMQARGYKVESNKKRGEVSI